MHAGSAGLIDLDHRETCVSADGRRTFDVTESAAKTVLVIETDFGGSNKWWAGTGTDGDEEDKRVEENGSGNRIEHDDGD